MLHEALKRAGHVVPASEIIVRTRPASSRPMRPLVYAVVLGLVSVVSGGGALVLYHQEPSYAEPAADPPRAVVADAAIDSPPPTGAVAFGTPTPVAAAPTAQSPEVRLLLARGDSLLGTGDFTAARLFYQRAAEQGDGAGALGVAKTYDPVFLAEAGYRTARGDAAAAERWYRQAEAAGEADAAARLERLRSIAPAH
ncbi:MAG: hypothetical protein JO021_16910 [Alphaproteobacteria bacterium]|nr:hypothetical protein [Alphaproteobacteria bacterium]